MRPSVDSQQVAIDKSTAQGIDRDRRALDDGVGRSPGDGNCVSVEDRIVERSRSRHQDARPVQNRRMLASVDPVPEAIQDLVVIDEARRDGCRIGDVVVLAVQYRGRAAICNPVGKPAPDEAVIGAGHVVRCDGVAPPSDDVSEILRLVILRAAANERVESRLLDVVGPADNGCVVASAPQFVMTASSNGTCNLIV